MGASDLLAGTVMDLAASLLNDTAKTVYTYAAQVPYVNIALQELDEIFQLHNVPVNEKTSAVITMPVGSTEIVYNGGVGTPTLPSDMVEPAALFETPTGTSNYIPMTARQYLPHLLENIPTSQFIYYVWQEQKIKVLAATAIIDIKIDYIRQLFATAIVNEASIINVVNAKTFLEYRTAGLCAEFIERNQASADSLNGYAILALERATGINVKGTQNIMTRRRPFRAAYKRGGRF
jgi:hypothetical protein